MSYRLYALRAFVKDWERACDFYEKTVGFPMTFKNPDMGWAEFDLGGPKLGVERVREDDHQGTSLVGRFLGDSIMVDDLDETYRELKEKGVEFTGPPERQPWGGVLAHFADPDGNVHTLVGAPEEG